MPRLLTRLWDRWFADAVRKAEADALAFRLSEAGRRPDYKTLTVLLVAAACLTAQNFAPLVTHPLADRVARAVAGKPADQLTQLTWWAGVAVLTNAIIPAAVVRWGFGERLRDYGVKLRGLLAGGTIYLAFVAVMAPLVWVCSADERFQQTYPFLRVRSPAELRGMIRWELLYAAQFAALEFFFRGFLVHGTKHRFGAYSVAVMTVPYCMVHFGKPPAECVASIVAGLALGLMSLKTGSIWLGAALHISVAWSMDFAVLLRRGLL